MRSLSNLRWLLAVAVLIISSPSLSAAQVPVQRGAFHLGGSPEAVFTHFLQRRLEVMRRPAVVEVCPAALGGRVEAADLTRIRHDGLVDSITIRDGCFNTTSLWSYVPLPLPETDRLVVVAFQFGSVASAIEVVVQPGRREDEPEQAIRREVFRWDHIRPVGAVSLTFSDFQPKN